LVVILNDNAMSITNNVGALSDYLGRIRSDSTLYRAREDLSVFLRKLPFVGKPLSQFAHKCKVALKTMLPGQLFEDLGFAYLGPFDGHNIPRLQRAIKAGMERGGPVLLHVYTQKGRGHRLAEQNPQRYHGVGPLNIVGNEKRGVSYSEVFGKTLEKLAEDDPRIVAVTAAMADGTGLGEFAKRFPDRLFDVGIAEQHAITLAGGMAREGLRPVVAIYSTFLQRGYDQIVHDLALQGLPVVIGVDRAGVVGDDGPTHHGVFDISFLRAIPNMTLLAPGSGSELAAMLAWALEQSGPVAIRYPRGNAVVERVEPVFDPQIPIPAVTVRSGNDAVIFAVGPMVEVALEAARLLEPECSCAVVNVRSIKPLDRSLLRMARGKKAVVTLEDHVLAGGFGSSILELLRDESELKVECIGYPDTFVPQGSISRLHAEYGLSVNHVVMTLRRLLSGRSLQVVARKDR
jgi:1-deoxy-D-xylulose-5-phosphate synthase